MGKHKLHHPGPGCRGVAGPEPVPELDSHVVPAVVAVELVPVVGELGGVLPAGACVLVGQYPHAPAPDDVLGDVDYQEAGCDLAGVLRLLAAYELGVAVDDLLLAVAGTLVGSALVPLISGFRVRNGAIRHSGNEVEPLVIAMGVDVVLQQ